MKILFLTQTIQEGPASRIRGYQMATALKQQGFRTHVSPGIGPWLYPLTYSHSVSVFKIPFYFCSLLKRMGQLNWMRQFDGVVIQKEISPHFFPLVEILLKKLQIPTIFDFDDALFARRLKPNWLPLILKNAAGVVAGNPFLAEYAKQYNSKTVVIPTAVDLTQITRKKVFSQKGPVLLGWIGSRSSWEHLDLIQKPLKRILSKNVHLLIVADHLKSSWKPWVDKGFVQFKKWNLAEESKCLQQMDIGLAPLKKSVWSQGKCGYKVLQYMATGLPVVASAVGVQPHLIEEGVHGCLANSSSTWEKKLSWILKKRKDWEKMGERGRSKVESEYSLRKQASKMKRFLRDVFKKE